MSMAKYLTVLIFIGGLISNALAEFHYTREQQMLNEVLSWSSHPFDAPWARHLTFGVNREKGTLLATDVWNKQQYAELFKDSGRAYDQKSGRLLDEPGDWYLRNAFVLCGALELETNGTTLNVSMIIGCHTPQEENLEHFLLTFWIQAFDTKNRLIGADFYGYKMGADYYNSVNYAAHHSIYDVKVDVLSKEKAKSGRTIWIFRASCSVELDQPMDFIPNIRVDMDHRGAALSYFAVGNQKAMTAQAVTRQVVNNFDNYRQHVATSSNVVVTAPTEKSAVRVKAVLPEITMSISRKDNNLLITFQPVVTGAKLEQSDISNCPWAWLPANTETNVLTNGWYVAPPEQPTVYRIKIDN